MSNNNINSLTFENHDTYIYYSNELLKSRQIVELTPTNPEDTDLVTYTSREVNLFTNGVIKFNDFNRFELNPFLTISSQIITIITNDGILMFNYASDGNVKCLISTNILCRGIDIQQLSNIVLTGIQTKTLATYKSDKYANYINVEIQVDFFDTYRTVTISY